MMVICEGPDGGGKTTLAQQICQEFDLEYRRPSQEVLSSSEGPSGIALVEWWTKQLRLPYANQKKGVYDRCFYISEPIYQMAQVQRDLIVSGHDLWRGISDVWACQPRIIFCIPPMDAQYSNVIQDGRASLKGLENKHLEKISFMYYAFHALWDQAAFDEVMLYDYTQHEPQTVFEWLRKRGY